MDKWVRLVIIFIGSICILDDASIFHRPTSFICISDIHNNDSDRDENIPNDFENDAEDTYTFTASPTLPEPYFKILVSCLLTNIKAFDSELNATTPPPKC